uniref:Moricin C4 n=1 Tax=Antheraea pernyi TaxID=7119 RepID=A0A7G9P6A0_ANTPE|nr:Moricin C4 [Antheraea pernyi]WCP86778.1 moricin-like peptide 1 [Antheraea pernyi]
MKGLNLIVLILSILAMFTNTCDAAPKGVGSAVKTGFRVISAAGTAHDVYHHFKNKKQG